MGEKEAKADIPKVKKKEVNCHGVSCMQANDAEGQKTIDWGRKEGERRKGLTKANTVIYNNKGGAPA